MWQTLLFLSALVGVQGAVAGKALPKRPPTNLSIHGGGIPYGTAPNGAVKPTLAHSVEERQTVRPHHLHRRGMLTRPELVHEQKHLGGSGGPIDTPFPYEEYARQQQQKAEEVAEKRQRLEIPEEAHDDCEQKKRRGEEAEMHGQAKAGLNSKDVYNEKYSDNGPFGYIQHAPPSGPTKTVRISGQLPRSQTKSSVYRKTSGVEPRILGEVLGDFVSNRRVILHQQQNPKPDAQNIEPEEEPETPNTTYHYAPEPKVSGGEGHQGITLISLFLILATFVFA